MNPNLMLAALACVPTATLAQVAAPSSIPGQAGSSSIMQAPPVAMPMPVLKPKAQSQNGQDGLTMPSYPQQPSVSPASEQLPATLHRPPSRTPMAGTSAAESPAKKLPAHLASQVSTGKKLQFNKTPQKISVNVSAAAPAGVGVDVARVNRTLAGRFESIALDESDRAKLSLDASAFSQISNQQPSARINTAKHVGTTTKAQSKTLMGQSAPADFTAKSDSRMTAQINPEVWCEHITNNEPRVSRVLVEADNLTPGMSFVLKGVCLGSKPGLIDVRFQGTNKSYRANVMNWGNNKILAALPDNIEGVPPTIAEIVVTTAGNRIAQPGFFTFEPKWNVVEVVDGLHRYSRVITCSSGSSGGGTYPFGRAWCEAGKNEMRSNGFVMPDHKWPYGFRTAIHYTEEDVEITPERGMDRWAFDLPPHARLKSWTMEQESFNNAKNIVRTAWDPSTMQLVVTWSMGDMGEQGFLRYTIDVVKVWMPVGIPFERASR